MDCTVWSSGDSGADSSSVSVRTSQYRMGSALWDLYTRAPDGRGVTGTLRRLVVLWMPSLRTTAAHPFWVPGQAGRDLQRHRERIWRWRGRARRLDPGGPASVAL